MLRAAGARLECCEPSRKEIGAGRAVEDCARAANLMVSVSLARGGAEPGSGRAKRVAKLKRELVLQWFLKRGVFWNAVKDARQRIGVEGRIGTAHHGGKHLSAVLAMDSLDWSDFGNKARSSILEAMAELKTQTIPRSLDDQFLLREWADFLVLCIMYDPPAYALIEFAEYGGPTWILARGDQTAEQQRKGAAPPVRVVRDPFESEIQRVVQISKVIDLIEETHPEIRAWDLVEKKGLLEQFRSEMESIPRHLHIEVEEDTTALDVTDAYRAIRRIQQKHNQGGASVRDPLVAVQCAVLYDSYNGRDLQDNRRKKWTYEKLAAKFGLPSPRAAKEHVRKGRALRQAKPLPEE